MKSKKQNDKGKFSFLGIVKKVIFVFVILAVIFVIANFIFNDRSLTTQQKQVDYKFNDVGKLVTQEYYGTIIKDSEKDRKLFNIFSIPLTKSRLIFSVDVKVTAGLDFGKISYDKIDENTLKIKLPKAEIFENFIINNTQQVYEDTESLFSNINEKERNDLRNEIIEEGEKKAKELGLLDKAEANAKNIIEKMVKSSTENVIIIWETINK